MPKDAGTRPSERKGFFARLTQFMTRPATKVGAGVLVIIGVLIGATGWAGFNSVVHYTNSVEFCTSCHEMGEFVYPEYAESSHYSNASGVRVSCADCHVPNAFFPKMYAKTRATFIEVPRHLAGRIGTEERFEEHKLELAERVWDRMKNNDSRECRDCHSWDAMSEAAQPNRAWREHVTGREAGETCIDCHQGVAHSLPAAMLTAEDEELDFDF